jgi:hypothetical protein
MEANNQEQSINLSTSLLQAIADYLGTQPYNQVAHLIGRIQKEVEVSRMPLSHEPTEEVGKPDEVPEEDK